MSGRSGPWTGAFRPLRERAAAERSFRRKGPLRAEHARWPSPRRSCGSSAFVQDLACVLRIVRADHDVVRSHGAQPVSSPGPAVRQPGQALDAGATQDRAEQLRLRLAAGDLDYDPVVHQMGGGEDASATRLERRAHLLREELRLLPGGEVASVVHLVEVVERGIGLLGPAARGPPDLARERREADRDRRRR